jgi:hypothetical protein
MQLNNFICFFILTSSFALATPKLQTKQAIQNLRYLTGDGTFSYLQQRSGSLIMSTNFSTLTILNKKQNTQYFLHSSEHAKKIIVEVDETFFNQINLLKTNEIYFGEIGKEKLEKIGEGRNPKLQLGDQWLLIYNPLERTIENYYLNDKSMKFKLTLANQVNPYFFPEYQLINPETIYYTDINSKGHAALLSYTSSNQEIKTIYKSNDIGRKIEFCIHENDTIVGLFNSEGIKKMTRMLRFKNNQFDSAPEVIYESPLSDIGNMLCEKEGIYFIKKLRDLPNNNALTEVALLNLKTKAVKVLTKLDYVSQMVKMDDKILAPLRGDFYVIKGSADHSENSLGKKLIKAEEKPEEKNDD